jgi:hypothetical protein
MTEIPLLDGEYRQAFLYLMDEINEIRLCSDSEKPGFLKTRTVRAEPEYL